ncbi:MAG: acetyl-CoA carboxylase biotin carboxyl carrier protein [Pirellula sp.]|jgi:acetyl-CoA carboxylase biotin carboxyl carrier protein
MTESNHPNDVFDIERIRKLIALMKEHDLGEIDLRHENQRIRLCGAGHGQPVIAAPMTMQSPAPATAPVPAAPSQAAPAPAADAAHIAIIKSPMVGTFYTKPNPNAKNFVEVGVSVQPDTVVCIIEAMKVFNEIPAEIRGKIVEVLVKNEEAVDFGKPLFKVDTRG